jgi:alpha-beta hydrolase superfamily lysophospholipase
MAWTVPTIQREAPTEKPRRRRSRPLVIGLIIVVVLILLFYAGGGWFFAGKIYSGALEIDNDPDSLDHDVEVLAVGDQTVTYSLTGSDNPHLEHLGTYGMAWEGGFAAIGEILETGEDRVVRSVAIESGTLAAGTMVDLIGAVWPSDPMTAHAIPYEDVTYATELGPMGAWYVPGTSEDWVIFVHGRSTPRFETLRMLVPVHDAGYQALIITYRNDPGAPEDPSGMYQYGQTETRDVEGAITYALDNGADGIALVGYSMGGAIVANTLLESALATNVDAVIFDAPMLDLEATIDFAAGDESLPFVGLAVPGSLVGVAKWMTGWRYDVDWSDYDYLDRASEFSTPILVFHGAEDDKVPTATSEDLAAARPDLVTYVPVADATHVMSWNLDPAGYEAAVAAFLAGHLR